MEKREGRVSGKSCEFGKASLRARDVIILKQVTTVYAAKGKIKSRRIRYWWHIPKGGAAVGPAKRGAISYGGTDERERKNEIRRKGVVRARAWRKRGGE